MQHKPDLLILHEPTSGLNPLMQERFFGLVKEACTAGSTCFLSSHVLSEIKNYCDRAAIIKDGKIVTVNTVANLTHTQAKQVTIWKDGQSKNFAHTGSSQDLLERLVSLAPDDFLVQEPSLEDLSLCTIMRRCHMTILKHELKQNFKSLLIWTLSVAVICAGCIYLYKSVEGQLAETAELYANMWDMTKAIGMDKVSLVTFDCYFVTEIVLMFGLGAGMFAGMQGAVALSKEEEGHTSEFLFTLPYGRSQILTWKYFTVLLNLLLFNIIVMGAEALAIWQIDLDVSWANFMIYHGLALLLQVEVATICFLISALSRKKQIGVALGLALLFYVMDMMSRIVPDIGFLKNWTPYNFDSGADVWSGEALNRTGLAIACLLICGSLIASFAIY